MAPPSAVASGWITSGNFSGAPTPRPPETMISALVRSTPFDVGDLRLDELGPEPGQVDRELLGRARARALEGRDGAGLDGDDDLAGRRGHLGVELAVEHPAQEDRARLHVEGVGDEGGVEAGGDAGRDVPAARRVGDQHGLGARGGRRAARTAFAQPSTL